LTLLSLDLGLFLLHLMNIDYYLDYSEELVLLIYCQRRY